ncbi:MAG: hypothetical protein LDLANPLL_02611 [Turneriella sp.]|nr:hypothetical protein [Turneriella sp.]
MVRITIVLSLIFALVYCSKKKLETPEAALHALQEAYQKRDAKAFVAVLSKDTLQDFEEKVDSMRMMFQSMPENPQAAQAFEALAKDMGLPVAKLKELTIEDFIGYMMHTENASGSETTLLPKEVLPPAQVLRRVEKGNKATLYFADDEKLSFIKTENGWRVHLSSENMPSKKLPLNDDE